MNSKLSLKIILIISIIGMIFSGYLSYQEIFKGVCSLGNTCTKIVEVPVCVYGFIMFLIILIISILGIRNKN